MLYAQIPDRSHPPAPGPPPALKLAPIQHFNLPNGLAVVVLEKHNVPVVQMNMVVRGGAVMDPPGKNGRASLTAAMLMDGAGGRDALQLADAIDYLGARIYASAGQHTTGISLFTPVAQLDSALALFADVILRPLFPPAELARRKKDRLTTLLQWRDEPRALASLTFNRTIFGSTHPYGIPSLGNEQSIRSFSTADLQAFHASAFHAGNATLIVVGDIQMQEIRKKIETAFGSWTGGPVEQPSIRPADQVKSLQIFLVDKPGAAQTEIRIGRIGAQRLTDDYFAIEVMNTILGGSFTSRLNENLREQHGYTYGASSQFDLRPLPGAFVAGAAVQTAVTDKALGEFMKELRGIREPVSDAELTRAKNYAALRFPGDFQSVGQIAAEIEEMVIYNLPDDYFNRYIERILAVTGEDVQRVARKYIDPDTIDIILVGDRKQIESKVAALNLGPLKNLTVEDVLGKAPQINTPQ
jgi:predicted Zn-dependent peptidase